LTYIVGDNKNKGTRICYGLCPTFIKKEQIIIDSMTSEQIRKLAFRKKTSEKKGHGN